MTKVILINGPRDGREMTLDDDPPGTINFGFAVDTPGVAMGDPIPAPLPRAEAYRRDVVDEAGRLRYVHVP